MISLRDIFKFKKKPTEEPEEDIDITEDEPVEESISASPKPKTNIKRIAILMFIFFVISGVTTYKYFQNMFKEPVRLPNNRIQVNSLDAFSSKPVQTAQNQSVPQIVQQGTVSSTPAHNTTPTTPNKAPIVVNTAPATEQTNTLPQGLQQRPMYIPSRDILTGAVDLQKQKDRIEELKLQIEAKKLEKDLASIISEMQLIPVQAEAHKTEIASRIAEKKVRPVEIPKQQITLPPPTVLSVVNNTATLKLSTGEQVRVKSGDMVGDYRVVSINSSKVTVTGKNGEQIDLSVQYPERYPVSPSMFGSKGSIIVGQPAPTGSTPAPEQYGYAPPPPPQFIPIPGGGNRGGR